MRPTVLIIPLALAAMVFKERTCPVCEMEIRHERGCPYEGLSMAAAWAQYRSKRQNAHREIK